MTQRYQLKALDGSEKTLAIGSQDNIIGRDADCDLCWPMEHLSRRHACIRQDGTRLLVEDLGSTNGTFVNNVRISAATVVEAGDVIRFGSSVFSLVDCDATMLTVRMHQLEQNDNRQAASSVSTGSDDGSQTQLQEAFPLPSEWGKVDKAGFGLDETSDKQIDALLEEGVLELSGISAALVVLSGQHKNKVLRAVVRHEPQSWSLGRDPSCDFRFGDATVSSQHATLIRNRGTWWLKDSESLNGTYINNRREGQARLYNKDKIRIGGVELVFRV